jgi:FkbM family methyltransferase
MHRLYEPETSKFIVKTLKKGDTFIDIGANNGYFSLMASILVGSTGKVYAFEPTPDSFKRLQTNVHINKFKNIKLFECALGDKVGKIKLNISKKEDGQNSIADIVDKKESIVVQIKKLDDILKGNRVNLIKIDVEGYEKEVFRGAIKTIKNNRNIKIVFENNPELMILRSLDPLYLLNFFKGLDFEVSRILPDGDIEKATIKETDILNLENLCAFRKM